MMMECMLHTIIRAEHLFVVVVVVYFLFHPRIYFSLSVEILKGWMRRG